MFFGHADFVTDPQRDWMGIMSPSPVDAEENFGSDVGLVDFDQDGHPELVVGAIERSRTTTPRPGRAYIYRGTDLVSLAALPNQSYGVPAIAPAQELTGPPSIVKDGDWFGWNVFEVGDVAGTDWGTSGGRPDVAIHPEQGDHPGGPLHQPVEQAGALFVFVAWDPSDPTPPVGAPFVKPDPVVLQTPIITETVAYPGGFDVVVVHGPQTGGRFGRGAASVSWKDDTGSVISGLLVGEPNASVKDPNDPAWPYATPVETAGRVFFFEAPLDGPNGTDNGWGDFVLLEPKDSVPEASATGFPAAPLLQTSDLQPTRFGMFGAWIGAGVYNDNFLLQQFFVSAHSRPVVDEFGVPQGHVGQVYTFHLPVGS